MIVGTNQYGKQFRRKRMGNGHISIPSLNGFKTH